MAGTGFPQGSPQADFSRQSHRAKVNFLAPPRTHFGGHKQSSGKSRFEALC
jgi:hypothetical protein